MKQPGFEDKHVLITGGAGGIGTSICKRLADAGHRVVTNYRQRQKVRQRVIASDKSGAIRALYARTGTRCY